MAVQRTAAMKLGFRRLPWSSGQNPDLSRQRRILFAKSGDAPIDGYEEFVEHAKPIGSRFRKTTSLFDMTEQKRRGMPRKTCVLT